MKKQLVCMILTALLSISMIACTSEQAQETSTGNYEIYLHSAMLGESCLRDDALVYSSVFNTNQTEPTESIKMVTINGTEYTLQYKKTQQYLLDLYTHEYVTDDGKICCEFWSDTQALAAITLKEQDMTTFSAMDQTQYEQWIHTFVSQFSNEDWNRLTPSCSSFFYYMGDSYGYGNPKNGFHAQGEENEYLGFYDFSFTKYIGGTGTTDKVYAQFSFLDNTVYVRLNRHQFDTVTSSALDWSRIDLALETFVNTWLKTNLKLDHFSIQPESVVCIDDNIMLNCTITIEYIYNDSSFENIFQIVIDIPDA